MNGKLKNLLFCFDLIGISPHLLIFNEKIYKSKLSCFLSIIIILFSIVFIILALTEYLKYDNPMIVYSKDNNDQTERNIFLKDFILMFQLVDIIDYVTFKFVDKSSYYYEAYYMIVYNNGTLINISLPIENCKLGRNLDNKYKDLVNNNNYGINIEYLYCIDHNYGNLSLFYDPKIGFSYILIYLSLKNDGKHIPENIKSLMITENNIIDHYNKINPIRKSYIYKFSDSYRYSYISKINYNFQFIKYESDEGLMLKKIKELKGVSFSDMTLYSYNSDNHTDVFRRIGSIEFLFNKSNFDSYRRSYKKIQSLLAEIMSVIGLFFEIGRQISYFLCNKTMSFGIIETLFNKSENKRTFLSQHSLNKRNKLSKDIKIENSLIDMSGKKTKTEEKSSIDYLKRSNEVKQSKIKEKNDLAKNESNNKTNQINFGINYFHIIKSFLCCCQDNRTKLINLCNNIINKDLSIERILERFYILDNIYHFLSKKNKDKIKYKINLEFKEINEYIKKINNEIKTRHIFEEEKRKSNSNIGIG